MAIVTIAADHGRWVVWYAGGPVWSGPSKAACLAWVRDNLGVPKVTR